jgi:Domain of unknown function (DUF6916)
MLDQISVDDFRPVVGESFALDDGAGTQLELALVEARTHDPEAPARDDAGRRSPFRVHFRGPAQPLLPQRIYRLEHAALGPLEIFIVPISCDAGGARYEAVFT